MADEQTSSHEEANEPDYPEDEAINDRDSATDAVPVDPVPTSPAPAPVEPVEPGAASIDGASDDYDDEPLPDVTVNLYINDAPGDVTVPTDLINAGLTDEFGNALSPAQTPAMNTAVDYLSTIAQEISNDGKGLSSKSWFVFVNLLIDDRRLSTNSPWKERSSLHQGEWTWTKILFIGLIALCIIAIVLAVLFLIFGKKFKKNKRPATAAAGATRSVVTGNPAAGGKYQQVGEV